MGFIFRFITSFIEQAVGLLVDFVKIEVLTVYVKFLENIRRIFIVSLCIILGAMLCLSGFLLIHIALFIYLPWSIPVKALCLLGLGLFYFIVPLCFVLRFTSKKTWLKLSRVDKFIHKS